MTEDETPARARRPSGAGRILRSGWFILIVVVLIAMTVVAAWELQRGPVFSLGPVSSQRYCYYPTARGNYSFWWVSFNLTNRGASASAAVVVLIDGSEVSYQHYFVASGMTAEISENVTDPAIPTDPGCSPHNVTAEIWGYLL